MLRGKTAYEYRKNLGKELAKEDNIKADLVVPVPDSGNAAALGYSQQKKIEITSPATAEAEGATKIMKKIDL